MDDTAGVQNTATCSGGVPDFTSITSTASSNPAAASLAIENGSFTFGVLNASYAANSEVAWYASNGTCTVDSQVYLAAGDGYYGNGSGLNGYIYPATGTILTSNPNWEVSFSDANLYVSPVGAGSLQFEISEQVPKPTGQYASGFLIPQSITVSGPTTCSSANVSLAVGLFGPQYMQATFSSPATTVLSYASSCGFDHLNWQQQVTVDPGPPIIDAGKVVPNNPTNVLNNLSSANCSTMPPAAWPASPCSLVAGPSSATGLSNNYPAYSDPPLGGYVITGNDNPYPFYDDLFQVEIPGNCQGAGLCAPTGPFPFILDPETTSKLTFLDAPDHHLSGDPPSTNPAPGHYIAFLTSLVGVSTQPTLGSVGCGAGSSLYCKTLYSWTWNSTFNGTACTGVLSIFGCSTGGVYQTAIIYPIIPGSGTGGVTITNINGVQLPAIVSPSQVVTTASGLAFSRVSQTFNGTVTITNISSSTISGPLQILFTGMPANVTLVNATANLSGTPYLTVRSVASIAPGQSVTVVVQFKNPSNVTINLAPVIYSESIN